MSKRAEEAALKAYPTHKGASKQWIKLHLSGGDCAVFIKGYEQAEKDLALTWEDIRRIVKIADDLLDDPKARVAFQNHDEEYYYKKVLDEYNKLHQTTEE